MSGSTKGSGSTPRGRKEPLADRSGAPVDNSANKLPTYQQLLDEAVDETFPASDPISPTAAMRADAEVSTPTDETDWALRPATAGDGRPTRSPQEIGSLGASGTSPSGPDDADADTASIDRGPIPFPTADHPPKSRAELIREAAYRRYLARGGDESEEAGGSALLDWLDAEAEVDGRAGSP